MKGMNTQKGFTLIELVVVIVILGILAVTAAPKFIDLQSDAKGATLQAVKASVESANSLVHSKALISGDTSGVKTVKVNSTDVTVANGWPAGTNSDTWTHLLDISADDFLSAETGTVGTDGEILWFPQDLGTLTVAQAKTAKCYVRFLESTSSSTKPAITVDIEGC